MRQEQIEYGDLLDTVHPDSYRGLPFKLHYAIRWIVQQYYGTTTTTTTKGSHQKDIRHLKPRLDWIVKVDDDVVVQLDNFQTQYLQYLNANRPIVVGKVTTDTPAHKTGKWAEDPQFYPQYYSSSGSTTDSDTKDTTTTIATYPPFAFGSSGYAMSRVIAQYLASQDQLYYWQGEDAGLGIWLAESAMPVKWFDIPEVSKTRECLPSNYIIGHNFTAQGIRDCYQFLQDEAQEAREHQEQ